MSEIDLEIEIKKTISELRRHYNILKGLLFGYRAVTGKDYSFSAKDAFEQIDNKIEEQENA